MTVTLDDDAPDGAADEGDDIRGAFALIGGSAGDALTATPLRSRYHYGTFVYGGPGADTLRGTQAPDLLVGNDGDDDIQGLGGDDALYGDSNELYLDHDDAPLLRIHPFAAGGNDVLTGGPGSDRLDADEGDDVFELRDDERDQQPSCGRGLDPRVHRSGRRRRPGLGLREGEAPLTTSPGGSRRCSPARTEFSSDYLLPGDDLQAINELLPNSEGTQTTDFGGRDAANALAIQSDGKIVAAGYHFTADAHIAEVALARYNADGSLDSSFSGDGKQTTDFGGSGAFASAIAIQGDRKIVAAGDAAGNAGKDFALARYKGDGSLDRSFPDNGKQTIDFGGMYDNAETITLQSDAETVVAGASANGDDFALARYLGR